MSMQPQTSSHTRNARNGRALRAQLLRCDVSIADWEHFHTLAIERFGIDIVRGPWGLRGIMPHGTNTVMTNGTIAPVPRISDLRDHPFSHPTLSPQAAARLAHYASKHRAESTTKTLESLWNLVLSLCVVYKQSPLPMTPATLARICVDMADAGYRLPQIRSVRWTVSTAHQLAKLQDPIHDRTFCMVFDGIAREVGMQVLYAKAPLTKGKLRAMLALLAESPSPKSAQSRAFLTLGYHGVLRRSTLVLLHREDVRFHEPEQRVSLYIRRSKTDQYGRGRTIRLAALPDDPQLCPYQALQAWCAYIGDEPGYLFRHLGPNETITDEPLACRTIYDTVKRLAKCIGLPPEDYAANSLRSGRVSDLARDHRNPIEIALVSGHLSLNSLLPYTLLDPVDEAPVNFSGDERKAVGDGR